MKKQREARKMLVVVRSGEGEKKKKIDRSAYT